MKTQINRAIIATCSVATIALLSGCILSSSLTYADSSSEASVTIPLSCTMSGNGMNSHSDSIVNGTYKADIGTTTVNVVCNDNNGFSIYAIGNSNNTLGNNKLVGTTTGQEIVTGTATGPVNNNDTSNWAMKLDTDSQAAYPISLENGFNQYHSVPSDYTKVATRESGTDAGTGATGASLTTTYAAYISKSQVADTYNGQVKYVLIHPNNEAAPEPCPNNQPCIRVVTPPNKTTYNEGDTVDLTGIVVKVYNPDGTEKGTVPNNQLTTRQTYVSNTYTDNNGVNALRIKYVLKQYIHYGMYETRTYSSYCYPNPLGKKNDGVDYTIGGSGEGGEAEMLITKYNGSLYTKRISGNNDGINRYEIYDSPHGNYTAINDSKIYEMTGGTSARTYTSWTETMAWTEYITEVPTSTTNPITAGTMIPVGTMTVTVNYTDPDTGNVLTTTYNIMVE